MLLSADLPMRCYLYVETGEFLCSSVDGHGNDRMAPFDKYVGVLNNWTLVDKM